MRFLVLLSRIPKSCLCDNIQSKSLLNYVPSRNITSIEKVNWVKPQKVSSLHPSKSGDLEPFEMPSGNQFIECYRNSETLKNANENVQKIFKMYNQSQQYKTEAYRKAMMDRVRSHQLDESSDEVKLARLTAQVRIYQYFAKLKSSKGKYRRILNSLIHRRRRGLRKLREKDYKKYEWLLEKLDLKYTADPICFDNPGKKKSTTLLAQVKKQKMKEQKLAEYKKTLDQQKIPYLKNKLEKLKWIKEQESAANLEPTVLDSDLEEIVKKIEQVKLNIEAAEKRGYARTVHPYTLEVYYPKVTHKKTK
ncbi:UNVERIFIED_CONTAM: hypothetical protein PYX00_002314 [Menopon gallinae]|uniref:Small ribosomal subunit protein uS15m n=1 Tax=Menopon gallinae TaxID=328185 RepID=A0AAW2IG81_9NEOP